MPRYPKNASSDAQVFDALGDATRRAIVRRLSRSSTSISDLAASLGMTVAAVCQHVSVLEAAELVFTEKVGRVVACRVDHYGLHVARRWIAQRLAEWEGGDY